MMVNAPERSLLGQQPVWRDPDAGVNAERHLRAAEYLLTPQVTGALLAKLGEEGAFELAKATHQYPCLVKETGSQALCFADLGLLYVAGKQQRLVLVEILINPPNLQDLARKLNLQRAAQPEALLVVASEAGLTAAEVEALEVVGARCFRLGDSWKWWSETQRPNQQPQAAAPLEEI